MFSYYGSKSKVIDAYPSPKHGKIIEPFAGSARYALKWFDRDVLLDLQQASEKDIMGLPNLQLNQSLDDFNLSEPEKHLMGFLVNTASSTPKKTKQPRSNIPREKKNIASQLFKIRHWEIRQGSYKDIANETATWFVDPPYQVGGQWYRHGNSEIDFSHLAQWCKSRAGQVIVCENTKADWLPFWPMRQMNGAYSKTTEAIWSNHRTGFEVKQLNLFA